MGIDFKINTFIFFFESVPNVILLLRKIAVQFHQKRSILNLTYSTDRCFDCKFILGTTIINVSRNVIIVFPSETSGIAHTGVTSFWKRA